MNSCCTRETGRLSRRRLLTIGGLGAMGLNLGSFYRAQAAAAGAAAASGPAPVRSCILLFYYGGPCHLDTWDMKPHAGREVRGEFQPIATTASELYICEHMPRTAMVADKLAVVRSLHHPMRNHNSAAVEALCGRTPVKGDLELLANDPIVDFPCYGSALSNLMPADLPAPAHVALPHVMHNVVMLPGQTAGFLGPAHNPVQVTRDPNEPDFCVAELELPAEVSLARLEDRQALLALIDSQTTRAERIAGASMDVYQQRAFDLLRSETVRRAFDLSQESDATRARYGRHTLGQSLLMARRLVEGGVRFVNVNDKVHNGQVANWDSHEDNFPRLKNDLLPPADQAFATLVEDLDARGLLDSTLVVALGEFGRTPRINAAGGRDHWPDCFSLVMAGGGVKGGFAYGASDNLGARPARDPVTPGDLAATLFWRLGLDHRLEVHDGLGRPYRLAAGEPIAALFA